MGISEMVKNNASKVRVLAVASEGGHWVQLLCLRPFINKYKSYFCSTNSDLAGAVDCVRYFSVNDVSRGNLLALPLTIVKALAILIYVRPQLIVSTGALPGVIFIVLGKLILRSKTVWVDSIANGSSISASGRLAKKFSDIWVSQWEDVAKENGADYFGAVI